MICYFRALIDTRAVAGAGNNSPFMRRAKALSTIELGISITRTVCRDAMCSSRLYDSASQIGRLNGKPGRGGGVVTHEGAAFP